MIKIILVAGASLFITACRRKTAPTITERTTFPESPKTVRPAIVENTPEFIAAGKAIYEVKCNRCHDLKKPIEFTTGRWSSILKTMIPRARLNDEQAKEITAYIMANAKK